MRHQSCRPLWNWCFCDASGMLAEKTVCSHTEWTWWKVGIWSVLFPGASNPPILLFCCSPTSYMHKVHVCRINLHSGVCARLWQCIHLSVTPTSTHLDACSGPFGVTCHAFSVSWHFSTIYSCHDVYFNPSCNLLAYTGFIWLLSVVFVYLLVMCHICTFSALLDGSLLNPDCYLGKRWIIQ